MYDNYICSACPNSILQHQNVSPFLVFIHFNSLINLWNTGFKKKRHITNLSRQNRVRKWRSIFFFSSSGPRHSKNLKKNTRYIGGEVAAQNFHKFPKILKVFQSATCILWIVVSCKENRFVNVSLFFFYLLMIVFFVSFLLCARFRFVSFRFCLFRFVSFLVSFLILQSLWQKKSLSQ